LRRRLRDAALLVLLAVCAGGPVRADDAKPAPRWLVGDLHVHVSPPDAAGHSTFTVATAMAAAKKAGLDFVALTPHDADKTIDGESGQALVRRLAQDVAKTAPADGGAWPIVVAGWEFTRDDPGHLGVLFADVAALADVAAEKKAAAAIGKGAVVVVNHPFFRPVASDLPVMKLATGDRGWRPFLGGGQDDLAWNAIEVWHERSVLVERLHATRADKFPDTQMATASLRAWDRATLAQKRRIVGVGGSDCHGRVPYAVAPRAMTSVLVETFDEEGLRRGLLAARATFGKDGGVSARSFAAASDVEGEKASIGGSLRAKAEVRLGWTGKAKLVENGVTVGEFEGGCVRKLDPPGAFGFWRIEAPGDAFSNCIYANLP
jgi:hypothetical protein